MSVSPGQLFQYGLAIVGDMVLLGVAALVLTFVFYSFVAPADSDARSPTEPEKAEGDSE